MSAQLRQLYKEMGEILCTGVAQLRIMKKGEGARGGEESCYRRCRTECERSIHADSSAYPTLRTTCSTENLTWLKERQGISGSFGLHCFVSNRFETKPGIILNDFGLGDLFLF